MGYQYGIEKMEDTITKLAVGDTFRVRLTNAFSELDVIETEDVTPEEYERILAWEKQFLEIDSTFVNNEGEFVKPDTWNKMVELANNLVAMAFEICQTNTKLTID